MGEARGYVDALRRFTAERWLEIERNEVTVTRLGLPRIDHMIAKLYLPEHRVARYS